MIHYAACKILTRMTSRCRVPVSVVLFPAVPSSTTPAIHAGTADRSGLFPNLVILVRILHDPLCCMRDPLAGMTKSLSSTSICSTIPCSTIIYHTGNERRYCRSFRAVSQSLSSPKGISCVSEFRRDPPAGMTKSLSSTSVCSITVCSTTI
jgi:hypothetical protein